MKIDIWSDIMCPFCYIGKRRLEEALEGFEHKNEVEIHWHSFQLDPGMKPQPGKSIYQYLAERKGQSLEWSVKMHEQVVQMAKAAGLEYKFDKAVIANSFDAHRLIHLAAKSGAAGTVKEALLKAYFTEGKDIGDQNTLMKVALDAGLRAVETGNMLNSEEMADEVHKDIELANDAGISGVPFFVFDSKYAVSGAQPAEVFGRALRQAWTEYETGQHIEQGAVCGPGGNC